MAMTARVFRAEPEDGASNGGGSSARLCVDGKVHLTSWYSWYDQTGCEERSMWKTGYGDFKPCDGSCKEEIAELPPIVEEQVNRILRGALAYADAKNISSEQRLVGDDSTGWTRTPWSPLTYR